MKFRAFIESGTRELEVDFEIDDEAAAHARLTEALAKIQKVGKKPDRATTRPSETIRATAPGGATQGSVK
jgi:hypothetical protein